MVGWGAAGWEDVEVGAQPAPTIKLETMIKVRLFVRVVILELGISFSPCLRLADKYSD